MLDKRGRYQFDPYDSYYRGGSAGVLGEAAEDGRLDRKEFVVGVEVGGHSKAYPFEVLADQPVVNDSIAGKDILVYMDKDTYTALAYERTVEGQTLSFRSLPEGAGAQAVLVDNETGSRWMALTGRAIEGPLTGKSLTRALSHLSFWFAWKDWNPETLVYIGPA